MVNTMKEYRITAEEAKKRLIIWLADFNMVRESSFTMSFINKLMHRCTLIKKQERQCYE